MTSWIKLGAMAALSLAVGVVVGGIGVHSLQPTPADLAAQEFTYSFGRLAARDGVPKSVEAMRISEQQLLAILSVRVGQQFDEIRDRQIRDETVRIAKLIESSPSLQAPASDAIVRWASESRRCMIKKSTEPAAVTSCVRSSSSAAQVTNSQARAVYESESRQLSN